MKRFLKFALVPVGCALGLAAQAQTPADNQWHGGISLGGAFASGNSSSRTLSANADGVKATTADKITLYSQANYGKSKVNGVNTTTANLLRAGGRYDYNLSDRTFVFGGAEGESNKAGGVKSRYSLNGGMGFKLVRSNTASLDLFGGVGYSSTSFTDNTKRKGAELLLGEEGSYKLSETTSVKQRLVVYPGESDIGTRVTFDTSLVTAISGGWTLNTGLGVRHAGKVPAGQKKTDSLVTVGFGFKY